MKKLITLLFISCLGLDIFANGLTMQPDTTRSVFEKGLDQYKLQKARHLKLSNDLQGALNVYLELYFNNQENPLVNYRIGECHFEMNNFDMALSYLEKSYELNPDAVEKVSLLYGLVLHRLERLDEALEQFNAYKEKISEKASKKLLNRENLKEVDRLIDQVNYAKTAIANPIDVKIRNLGSNVNSTFEDYGPAISANGKTLVFTSRRPDTKGGMTDTEDHKYFEDIYISEWDEENNMWGAAEAIPGRLNTEFHDACLSLDPDGEHIYVYKNFGENGSGEVYVSRMSSSGNWGTPKSVGETVNTSFWESSASVTADGNKMYFVSERKNGTGMGDIWVVEKVGRRDWGEPVNIGPVINTSFDEKMVAIHPQGNVLFFASDGHLAVGGYDLFKSVFKNGQWSTPVNIGYPINTVNDELNFSLAADAQKGYYSGYKSTGFGERDIYEIDFSGYDILQLDIDSASEVIVKGKFSNSSGSPVAYTAIQFYYTDVETDDKEGPVLVLANEIITNRKGEYSLVLQTGKSYKVRAKSISRDHKNLDVEWEPKADQAENWLIEKDWALEAR